MVHEDFHALHIVRLEDDQPAMVSPFLHTLALVYILLGLKAY